MKFRQKNGYEIKSFKKNTIRILRESIFLYFIEILKIHIFDYEFYILCPTRFHLQN